LEISRTLKLLELDLLHPSHQLGFRRYTLRSFQESY
jgi:hypothetical protein